jgi:2-polyprenyl-3-methyl-5-hydroxy-6-metoxy-1,4-benzoquinol methylase
MELTFDGFRERANDKSLSKWEKIGFPDSYRKDIEKKIFSDISNKLNLNRKGIKVLDIGCGCSELVDSFINNSIIKEQELYLVDSEEMLQNIVLGTNPNVHLVPGYFPKIDLFSEKQNYFDSIVIYSVIQYVFLEQSIFDFIHKCLNITKHGGSILIGDIPNISSRERFLLSDDGKTFSTSNDSIKGALKFDHVNTERIDDSIILAILARFRNFGCETYLLPQAQGLPFSNRREDILIIKR